MNSYGINFQRYTGSIQSSCPAGFISFIEFIGNTQTGWKNPEAFAAIRAATAAGNTEVKSRLKSILPHFTPAVVVKGPRRLSNIERFTGLMQIDLDGLTKEAAPVVRDLIFEGCPAVVAAFISPSGEGVKGLLAIPPPEPTAVDDYKAYHRAFKKYFLLQHGLADFSDRAPENPVLPMYASYDKEVRYRMNHERWYLKHHGRDELVKVKQIVIRPPQETYTRLPFLDGIRRRIEGIQAPHHTEMLPYLYNLGGIIAAEDFKEWPYNPTEAEVRTAVNDAIMAHPYMGTNDTPSRLKSAQDTITAGMMKPKPRKYPTKRTL